MQPYRFYVFFLTVLLQVCFLIHPVAAHSSMDVFRRQFHDGQCDQLREPLRAYRSQLIKQGRRNLQVDYMLSICLCPSPGADALRVLPKVYRHLTKDDIHHIQTTSDKCSLGSGITNYIPQRIPGVIGKGGTNILYSSNYQMSDEAADKYTARIYDKSQKSQALVSLKRRGYNTAVATQSFVLTGNKPEEELRSVGKLMENVLDTFLIQFGFEPTQALITVYLFDNKQTMGLHAKRLHDVNISSKLWAYTFPLDASITILQTGGLGTVGHEVFHALLDQNVPYAPPWLNEGTAALFEEFRFIPGGGIEGTFRPDHWRVKYFLSGSRPTLTEIIGMDWAVFDAPNSLQVNHATAKFFAMFLQQKKKLQKMVQFFRNQDPFDHYPDEQIIENVFGKDIRQVEKDFEKWLTVTIGLPVESDSAVFDTLRLTNSAINIGWYSGNNWYEWTAYIDGSEQSLGQIHSVSYHIHESFSSPIRRGDGLRKGHPITSTGWGAFILKARVVLKNGSVKDYEHRLEF